MWAWIWRHHTVIKAVILAAIVLLGLLAISILVGRVAFADITDQKEIAAMAATDTPTLNTLAQVTGTIFGTLLAVVTFSVGLRAHARRPFGP
jgi:hypothetical protein